MDWYDVQILEVVEETPVDRRFVLSLPEAAAALFGFRPGQHVLVRLPGPDGGEVKSALTPSSDPGGDGALDVTVRGRGSFGAVFYGLEAGARFDATAPRGRFCVHLDRERDVVCFAQGHSVTPYRATALELARLGHEGSVTLVVEEEVPEHLVFEELFRRTEKAQASFRYVPVVGDAPVGWSGRRGEIDADVVRDVLPDPANATVYVCGPTAFVERVVTLATQAGVSEKDLRKEKWG